MFEDTKGAGSDNDYNYVVLHIEQRRNGDDFFIRIQPIAMGNNWLIEKVSEQGEGEKIYSTPAWINQETNWINTNGYPMGLTISHIRTDNDPVVKKNGSGYDWVNYPQEGKNIETVFSGFKAWLKGEGAPNCNEPQGDYIDAIDNYDLDKPLYKFN